MPSGKICFDLAGVDICNKALIEMDKNKSIEPFHYPNTFFFFFFLLI
jgi:hypothetical protein